MDKLLKFNNKLIKSGNRIVFHTPVDPYNPLGLPPNTVRVRTSDGNVPDKTGGAIYHTATIVSGTSDVYDVYRSGTDFNYLLYKAYNVIEVLGANTSNVRSMEDMFEYCTSLTDVALFDTSNVISMKYMLERCGSLISVPLFNTSKVTDMRYMLYNCYNVQSGALALYQQASTQATPPTNHSLAFHNCGSNTQTGAAELAQIPSDWK